MLHREVLEDDGGNILTVSRSNRKNCGGYADGYAAYAAKMGFVPTDTENGAAAAGAGASDAVEGEIAVVVWREVLQNWCDKEGWDLVWTTSREYPIEASAVFKGRFVDVASALVRNFGRATPVPYAKFYKGNRVLVISTNEE